ncbi:hypothetical protein [Brachybacterium sp. UMB0905]|uniref:hypothetical protein n=1 Tax=Brachybacterium sp. UMB0905 TaxID=2069310 RepID=UPI00130411BF
MQDQTGLSLKKIIQTLRPLRTARIAINGTSQDFPPEITTDARHIITAIAPEIGH